MPASDIRKHDEADREDWNARGIAGIVAGVSGTTIILRTASAQGQARQTVTVSGHIQLTSQRLRRAALDGAD